MRHMLVLWLCLSCAGCIQGTPGNSEAAAETAQRHILTKAPEPEHHLGVRFGTKVELLGYDIEPDEPEPGKTVTVTWYWHCMQELGQGYNLFTHLVDSSTSRMCVGCNFDRSTVDSFRTAYPPGRWQTGQYLRDRQRITVPEKIPFVEAELRVGIYRETSRLAITGGPHDRQKRARGPRFVTGYQPPPIPELIVPLTKASVTIDGRLDDPDWVRAAHTKAFVKATNGARSSLRTKASVMYDTTTLFLGFECQDDNLHSTYKRRDDPLWKQDAVEIFIDPPGRGRDYLEFQVSPAGKLFDTKVRLHPKRDDSYDGKARAAVHRRGTLNDDSDRDQGWTAELAIPLSSLAPTPPQPGHSWRLNMFRLDDRLEKQRAFLAWSPPMANTTHIPNRFGTITFGPIPLPEEAASDAGDGGTAGDGATKALTREEP